MHAAAGLIRQGLGTERAVQPVARGHRLDHIFKRDDVVRRCKRCGVLEIHLVLAGALFMMAGFRPDVHFLQRQADLTPDVLAPVQGRDVKIAAVVLGTLGGPALRVPLKQVKFTFRAHPALVTCIRQTAQGPAQDMPSVRPVGASVRRAHTAEKTHHAPRLRPPRKHRERGRVREQEQVRFIYGREAQNGRCVERNPRFERARKLAGHDGDIFQRAHHIAERQSDELYVVFLHKLEHGLHRRIHCFPSDLAAPCAALLFCAPAVAGTATGGAKPRPVRAARCYE